MDITTTDAYVFVCVYMCVYVHLVMFAWCECPIDRSEPKYDIPYI